MSIKQGCEDFRCPEFVPANAPDDFCIPEQCCPERIKTPKYPSANSCLPLEELEVLDRKIDKANKRLLDLALSEERTSDEVFQAAFDGLVGQYVKVVLVCLGIQNPVRNIFTRGRVCLVGFDFVVLRRGKREIIVPFEKIQFIRLDNRFAEPDEKRRLQDIDPCFRRELTYNFGAVVSSSPELIQLFYRLRLKIYLLLLVGEKVRVVMEGIQMRGTINEVHEESLTLKMKGKKREIPFEKVCKMVIATRPPLAKKR
ncbi:hypothetical protein ACOI1C_08215 [Bacillus sp. DJP31]|uniref:hypothetical protein n=1 Tax=Bacillus sp. DJP31 TaxID=3409789 RepID=UPI003BB5C794